MSVYDLVLIQTLLQLPMQWKMGRIIEVHLASDNVVYVTTISTTDGTIKIPVVKLEEFLLHEDLKMGHHSSFP